MTKTRSTEEEYSFRMKKIVGFVALFIAIGMLIMLITHNRLVGVIIIALLLFVGYNCFCGD